MACGASGSWVEEENACTGGSAVRGAGIVCLAVLLLLCSAGAVSAAWNGTVNATWYEMEIVAGHTGASDNPFLIYDEMSLAALANETNTNTSQNGFAGKYIQLKTNLDLNGTVHLWMLIENTTTDLPSENIFKGTFDGDNHTISNMNMTIISASTAVYGGLFGYMKDATIQNVGVVNTNVTVIPSSTVVYSGGLAGYIKDSIITNCYAAGVITAQTSSSPVTNNLYSDGLVRFANGGSIMNCYATGVASSPPTPAVWWGGSINVASRTVTQPAR